MSLGSDIRRLVEPLPQPAPDTTRADNPRTPDTTTTQERPNG